MSSSVSFGTNTNAQRKRVYYTETATAIAEGMPLCYAFDDTTNVLGIDTGASNAASSTTTEGGLNEGRFLRVEDPDADNIHAFAGVVAHGPKVGTTGACWLDIFIPNSAIVPVLTDQACVMGRTILAVNPVELFLTAPHEAGRPVAIAAETNVALAGSAGLILAKLEPNLFIWQQGDNAALLCDDEDSGSDFQINKIKVTSAQTTGSVGILGIVLNTVNTDGGSAIYLEYGNTGTGAGGMKLINAYVEAAGTAITSDVTGIKMQTNLLASSALLSPAKASGVFSKVHLKTGGGAHTGDVYAGRFELGLDDTTTGDIAVLYFAIAGAGTPDYFFVASDAATVAYTADTTGTNQSGALKIKLGGVVHYLHTFDATDGAT